MDTRKLMPKAWPRPRMPKLFKRMNAPYRMVFIDERTLQEVASFRVTRHGAYGLFSAIAVLTVAVTLAVLLFTPLKYYIPGYGSGQTRSQALVMQQRVDSLTSLVAASQRQSQAIHKVLAGEMPALDTTLLDLERFERERLQSVVPQAKEVKKIVGQD